MTATATPAPRPPGSRRWGPRRLVSRRRVDRIVRGIVIAAVVAVLLAPLAGLPFGVHTVVVRGGSMAPTYGIGDVLIAGPPTGDDLAVGAPVFVGDGDGRYVHRVVERDGDRARLRGDANAVTDPGWTTQSDVTGVVIGHVGMPVAVLVSAAISLPGRICLILGLVLVVLLPLRSIRHNPAPVAVSVAKPG